MSWPLGLQKAFPSAVLSAPLGEQPRLWAGCASGSRSSLVPSSSGGDVQCNPLRLRPTPSSSACFYVPAQIDCDTFISSSVPLQQGILCCEFMAGLCPSLSYLVGQSGCNTWSSQHSHIGKGSE